MSTPDRSHRLNVLAVSLVVVTLLGSVVIPARLTRRSIGQLDGIAAVDHGVAATIAQVRTREQTSLVVNAALVVLGLAAVMAVVALTRRERYLATVVQRRLVQESALREAAEALAQTFTVGDVTEQIVRTAVRAGVAEGAFVEHVVAETGETPALAVVEAAAGARMPARGRSQLYGGSHAQQAIDHSEPVLVHDLLLPVTPGDPAANGRRVSAIVVPLTHTTAPIGALFLVGPERTRGHSQALAGAYTFGKLATLAYEKVRLLEEARHGREQLERAMKSRSRLMRGFSHDVKNPLGAADGYAELLTIGIHGELTTEQRDTLHRIRRCIRTALELIEDLHQLGRAETGNIVLETTRVDLADLLRAIAEDYQGAARTKGLSLKVDVAPDVPIIETDRLRVREVVGNLLSNAIKYTSSGSVTLRLRKVHYTAPEAERVRIDVADTGHGIPAEKHGVIFEEFTRLGTGEGGAGVGLAISKLFAEALGGRISVASQPGKGSTFSLWLPRGNREPDAQAFQSVFSQPANPGGTAGYPRH